MTRHDGSISGIAGRGRAATVRFPRRAAVRASAQSAAFVAGLLGRHGTAVAAAVGDAREFRRERRAVGAVSHQHWHSTWSPRLVFSLGSALVARSEQGSGVANAGDGGEQVPPMAEALPNAIPTAARFARVDRLTAKATPRMAVRGGDETSLPRSDTSSAPVPPLSQQPTAAITRVLHRPPPTAIATASAAVATPPPAPAFTSPLERYATALGASPTAPAMLAAIDVEGLADRVVRVIDRRLVASRERHGRI